MRKKVQAGQASLEYVLMVTAALFFFIFAAVLVNKFVVSSQQAVANQSELYAARLTIPSPGSFPSPSPCADTDVSCGPTGNCANCNASDGYYGTIFCSGNNRTQEYRNYYCNTSADACAYDTFNVTLEICLQGCSNGACLQDNVPSVSLISPADGATVIAGSVSFNFTPLDDRGFSSATLYGNFTGVWQANQTNQTTVTNDSNNSITISLASGYYAWNVRVCDNASTPQCAFAGQNYSLLVIQSDNMPNVSLTYPSNNSLVAAALITFNFTSLDDRGFTNATLWGNFTGVWQANQSNQTIVVNASNNSIAINLSFGFYVWNVFVCDNATPAAQCSFAEQNYSLTIETPSVLYQRSDTHTVNGLNAYQLKTANSASYSEWGGTLLASPGCAEGSVYPYFRSDVYVRHDNGSETLIGSDVAQTTRTSLGEGFQSATWNSPETLLAPSDAIVVVEKLVRSTDGSTLTRVFVTSQLNASKLRVATWTFTRWTKYWCSSIGGGTYLTQSTERHGDATYATRIEGFSYEKSA